jgi:hypothetical protein
MSGSRDIGVARAERNAAHADVTSCKEKGGALHRPFLQF